MYWKYIPVGCASFFVCKNTEITDTNHKKKE